MKSQVAVALVALCAFLPIRGWTTDRELSPFPSQVVIEGEIVEQGTSSVILCQLEACLEIPLNRIPQAGSLHGAGSRLQLALSLQEVRHAGQTLRAQAQTQARSRSAAKSGLSLAEFWSLDFLNSSSGSVTQAENVDLAGTGIL